MPADLPIACSLSAPELSQRLATMGDLGRDALVGARVEVTRAELRFAARDGIGERIDAVVDAESECCPFFTMRVTREPATVVLTVDAPEGAGVALQELVAAFGGLTRR